jgi:hypothetical protein
MLPTIYVRSSKSGNDGNLSIIFIKKKQLWVGNGYLSNEEETQGRSNFMGHKHV